MAENTSKGLERKIAQFIDLTLKDIKVELADEFDRNFEREAFFSEKWARRKYCPDDSRGLLVRTDALRQSIRSEIEGQEKVVFSSDRPYARIHNEGGTITVTRRMKGYFWHKYRETIGQRTFKRDGSQRNNKKNSGLNSAAEFYRAMALKKVGSKIIIPKRQFIGRHPDMERMLYDIAMANVKTVFNN